MNLRSIKEADIGGKRVLMRADFDVPLEGGRVVDDTRIRAVLPTLELLHARGAAKIILLAHLGRPGGKAIEGLRVAPVAMRLHELTRVPFELRENLRFDPREEANNAGFAKELAGLGDVFVNEAFADSHRAHASIVGIPTFLPSYAGLRLQEEVTQLSRALTPPKGAVAIIGGAKFETKVPLLTVLIEHYTHILLGGALGNDIIRARGFPVGVSTVSATPAPEVLARSDRLQVSEDAVVAEAGANAERTCLVNDIRANERIIDIGPRTRAVWGEVVSHAPFVLWNGPLGVYEEGYRDGTDAVAAALADAKVRAVVGGGDTIAALSKHSFDPAKVFLSTGGGAMLEFLARGTLPGLEPLKV
ncbi:phosphoglycerate kinase [Patescibacteria group bacterium]|nr:phosphoglycerate kinase [Patescibacteria group bacterium]